MRKQLLFSTVALLAGLGLAAAQQPSSKQESHSGGAAVQKEQSHGARSREGSGGAKGENRKVTTGQGHEQGQRANESAKTVGQGKSNNRDHAQSQNRERGQQGKQAQQGKAEQGKQAQQGKAEQGKQAQQGKAEQGKQEEKGTQSAEGKQGPNRSGTSGQAQRERGQGAQSKQGQQGQNPPQGRNNEAQQGRNQHGQTNQAEEHHNQQGQNVRAQEGRNEQAGEQGRVGQGGRVQLSEQQRTEIRDKVFAERNVPRMDNVNFSLNVGTTVPNRVRFQTVPDLIVGYYPQFRNDDYFVVRDEIVIVDRDHKIVATMPVGSSSAQLNTRGSVGVASRGESANLSTAETREMQQMLVRQGYHITADGEYGPQTREALMEFQRKNGLQASGRMDNETMTKLGLNEHGSQAGERSTTSQGARGREGEHGNTAQERQNEQGANPSSTVGQARPQGQ
jgi:hypothetical protein